MSTLEPPARVEKPGGFAHWLTRMQMKHGRKLVIAMPYVWRGRSRLTPTCWTGPTGS